MLFSNLLHNIETHADKLTAEFVADLETNPKTWHFARIAHDDLASGATNLYGRLADWLGVRDHGALDADFTARAMRQRNAGIPLSEVLYAVILLKKHVWEFVKRNALVDSIDDLYQRDEAIILIAEFFDKLIYATALGYEGVEEHWKDPNPFV